MADQSLDLMALRALQRLEKAKIGWLEVKRLVKFYGDKVYVILLEKLFKLKRVVTLIVISNEQFSY